MPILFLTLLAPIGLILPADAGEKMSLQITVMLTVVIYIDVLQGSIPGKRTEPGSHGFINRTLTK